MCQRTASRKLCSTLFDLRFRSFFSFAVSAVQIFERNLILTAVDVYAKKKDGIIINDIFVTDIFLYFTECINNGRVVYLVPLNCVCLFEIFWDESMWFLDIN